jgi:ABC-type branched-subunit amino acid transport system permease subunit
VGQSRQVSLGHAIFVALGATTMAHLHNAGVPFGVALPLAGLAVVPLGALISIPAIRLSGLFLALATFGFGVLTQNLLFPTSFMFGSTSVVNVPRPAALHGDRAFFYFVLAVVVLGVLAVEAVRRSRLGRMLVALGDSPTAVSSLGVNPLATRVLTFCLSAFLAAIAGALIGAQVYSVNTVTFSFFQSLVWVTVLVAAGAYSFGGAVLAALLFNVVPMVFTAKAVAQWQPVAFGVLALTLAQGDNGLVGLLGRIPWRGLVGGRRAATDERLVPDEELIPAEVGRGSYEVVSR